MERTQFTFYESFAKAVSRIKKKADRADAYDAICAYAFYGVEPDLDSLPDTVAIAFEVVKPILDTGRRKANSGKKGGGKKQTEANAKQGENASKAEASASKAEANASKAEARGNRKQEKEQDKDKEKEKEKDKEQMLLSPPISPSRGNTRFVPPTLSEVSAYCQERNNGISPQSFIDYYAARGWKLGKDTMKDWKAAVRTWENRRTKDAPQEGKEKDRSAWMEKYL